MGSFDDFHCLYMRPRKLGSTSHSAIPTDDEGRHEKSSPYPISGSWRLNSEFYKANGSQTVFPYRSSQEVMLISLCGTAPGLRDKEAIPTSIGYNPARRNDSTALLGVRQ